MKTNHNNTIQSFRFKVSTNLLFGTGECKKLGQEATELGFCRVAVIVDKAVISNQQVLSALNSLVEYGIPFVVYKNESVEPTYDYLEEFKLKFAGEKFDGLIGIGGGSTLDLAKGMAVLLTNEGPPVSFRGFPKLKNKPLPVIAIPTTAGTGSEVTFNAVFTDTKEKRKLGINSILNFPVCAIIDPLIYVDCPQQVTVSSGSDALVHTLESFVHRNHTLISRMYSKEAFCLLFNNLVRVIDNPYDLKIRANLALGAYLAGIALMNAGSGPAAAFSYPLGAVYHVPHGYAGAIFLSSIVRTNVDKGYLDYAELYDLIEGTDKNKPIKDKNREFVSKIQELMDKLGIPRSLSHFGLGSKDIDFMIGQYDKLKAGIEQNPVAISKEDAEKILFALA